MKSSIREFPVRTSQRLEIIDITDEVSRAVKETRVTDGLVAIWTPHTTAAVTVNENDPDLWKDILELYVKIAPIEDEYRHNRKYAGLSKEQNAHAHILSSLIKPGLTVPISNGVPILGMWQRFLFDELDGPRSRKIFVQITGQ